MAENSHSRSGTSLTLLSFPSREARSCALESISTETLLTAQHATVQQIRLAPHLNETTAFISVSLFPVSPTSCWETFPLLLAVHQEMPRSSLPTVSPGCSCCLSCVTISKENPGGTDHPVHLHPSRFPNLQCLWYSLSPWLCSTPPCRFIFPIPPCQHCLAPL